jgi:hypothetical protein
VPRKEEKKTQVVASVDVEEFSKSFENDFCLIACMSISEATSVWFVDNEASSHMIGRKEYFNTL